MALPSPKRACAVDSAAGARVPSPAAPTITGGTVLIDPKTKRITIPVSKDIDLIRDRLAADTGITMSYVQIFNFLIHFYVERANEPKSKWRSLS
jgi:hypothetical protein